MASAPSSFGYGWSGIGNVQLIIDDSGNLTYQDEASNYLGWTYNPGPDPYQPTTNDNYVLASYDGGTNQYTLTFKDSTQRLFDGTAGWLLKTVDRNGCSLTYNRTDSGVLLSIVDSSPAARTINFDYGDRTDGQPVRIYFGEEGSDVYRAIGFTYYTEETDPNNVGKLCTITSPGGEVTTCTYGLDGYLHEIIDPTGKVQWTYTYDAVGRKLTEQYYDQSLTTWTYGMDVPTGGLVNAVSTVTEDLTGTSPAQTSVYYFDTNFNTTEIHDLVPGSTDPNVTALAYNDTVSNNPYLVTQVVDPNMNVSNMTYNRNGNLATYQNAQLSTWILVYAEDTGDTNPKHRNLLVSLQRPPVTVAGVSVTYPPEAWNYDGNGNLSSYVNSLTQTTGFTVNSYGSVTAITDALLHVTAMTYYTGTLNLESITVPGEPGDTGPRTTTLGYDPYDNVNSVTNALSETTNISSDADNRVVQIEAPLTQLTTMSYTSGLLTNLQLPDNQASGVGNPRNVTPFYDSANRVSSIFQDVGGGEQAFRVGYGYDGFSNVTQLIRQQTSGGANLIYSAAFDALNRAVQSSDPLGRASTISYAPYCRQNTVTTARGVERTSVFDNLCRLTSIMSQTEVRQFGWDELSRLVSDLNSGIYNESNYNLAVSANGRTFLRDALDRVTQITFTDGKTVGLEWDQVGRLQQLTDVYGVVTVFGYFDDNRLATVSFTFGGTTYVFSYTWDLAGRIASVTYPEGTGLVLSFTNNDGTSGWDANGRLTGMRYLQGSDTILGFAYLLDNSGNRTQVTEINAVSGASTTSWGYDWLDRLTQTQVNDVITATYTLDNADNRIAMTQGSDSYVFNVDICDQLTNTMLNGSIHETFVFDDDGNMSTRTLASSGVTTAFTWNDFNNLIQFSSGGTVSEADCYDTDGVRRLRPYDGTRYYHPGGAQISEKRPTSGQVSFIQGHQLLGLAEGGNVYFFLTDGLGSVRQVIDTSGTVVATYGTDEYGIPNSSLISGSAELLANTFVGGLGVRNETGVPTGIANRGLYYMQQRWMDPGLGRFLNRDPMGFGGSMNLFNYVDNRPTKWVDPLGLYAYAYDQKGYIIGAFETPSQMLDFLQNPNIAPNSIARIAIFGHADPDEGISFITGGDNKATNGLLYESNGSVYLSFYRGGPGTNITNLLKKKLTKNAEIDLGGCDTGADLDDLQAKGFAQRVSSALPGKSVVGARGLAFPLLPSSATATWMTFISGVVQPNLQFMGTINLEQR